MSGTAALGIDVGTSGVRAAILEPGEHVVATSAASMNDYGANSRDPKVWLSTLTAALEALFQKVSATEIGAIAIDGTSGTVLGLDIHGQPVGDGLMYNDAVKDPKIPAAIASVAPRDSAAHGASSALARSIALQDRPGVVRIVHQADWIAEQIAGTAVPTDESNALKTGYDPVARRWPSWLEKTPLRQDLLAEVVPAGQQTGSASGRFGLPKGAALIAGATDGCASFLATGASEPGDAVTALGTTLTVKLLSDSPIFAPEFGIYSHRIGNRWLAGGASNTGGGVLAEYFEPDEIIRLSAKIDPNVETGLDYYPLTAPGERFPVNDPALAPRLEPRPDDDATFLQGIFEGIARIEALGYNRLVSLGAPKQTSIRTVGGGARNTVWQGIRLRHLGLSPADVVSNDAAVGVARLALTHLDQS
ncbi:MAG: FGGY-family carbohydrate kinase [Pseudomonadota bacterium]